MPPYSRQDATVFAPFSGQQQQLRQQQRLLTIDSVREQQQPDEALIEVSSSLVKSYENSSSYPLVVVQHQQQRPPLPTIPEHEFKTLPTIPERQVCFATQAQVYPVLHLEDYTQDEIEDTWYGPEENFRMRVDAREAVRWRNKDAMRGLEAETPEGHQQLNAVRLNSLYFVFAEQGRQRQLFGSGVVDDMALAAMYSHTTFHSKQMALELARQDAAVAKEYQRATTKQRSKESFSCDFLFDVSRWFALKNNVLLEDVEEQQRF